nr:MAG TPA: hypothetical protein [Caudoviricetes sp.]
MPYDTITTDKYIDLVHAKTLCDTAIANGYSSIAIATAPYTQAIASKTNSLAVAFGKSSAATALKSRSMAFGGVNPFGTVKGVEGSFLILTECDCDGHLTNVVAVEVDGKNIFPNVCYVLLNGCIMPLVAEERHKYPTIEIKIVKKQLTDVEKQNKGVYTAY